MISQKNFSENITFIFGVFLSWNLVVSMRSLTSEISFDFSSFSHLRSCYCLVKLVSLTYHLELSITAFLEHRSILFYWCGGELVLGGRATCTVLIDGGLAKPSWRRLDGQHTLAVHVRWLPLRSGRALSNSRCQSLYQIGSSMFKVRVLCAHTINITGDLTAIGQLSSSYCFYSGITYDPGS